MKEQAGYRVVGYWTRGETDDDLQLLSLLLLVESAPEYKFKD